MRNILILAFFIAPVLSFGQTEEALPDSYFLLLGKIQYILSEKSVTSQQLFGADQLITLNARLGKIWRPKGMSRDTELRTEMIPNDTGIAITVGKPCIPNGPQGGLLQFHDTKKKEFRFFVPMPNHMVVVVSGLYGTVFSEQLLKELFNLAPAPPPIDNDIK